MKYARVDLCGVPVKRSIINSQLAESAAIIEASAPIFGAGFLHVIFVDVILYNNYRISRGTRPAISLAPQRSNKMSVSHTRRHLSTYCNSQTFALRK